MTKEEESILELLEKEKLLGYIFATDVYKSIEELLEKETKSNYKAFLLGSKKIFKT